MCVCGIPVRIRDRLLQHCRWADVMKKRPDKKPTKELYEQLRRFSCEQLWEQEVPQFNSATPEVRGQRVALIRAVGVVFSETGNVEQKDRARPWLRGLLQDPDERIRRYAMTALPKLGAGLSEEQDLLSLLRKTTQDREKKFLGQTLSKIGGVATLQELSRPTGKLGAQTEQKVRANLARSEAPSRVRMDQVLTEFWGLRIHLHGRYGLEQVVKDEVEEAIQAKGQFRIVEVRSGLVALTPVKSFTLGDLYSLRCFGFLSFVLGSVRAVEEKQTLESLARVMTSPVSRRLLKAFTEGSIRYRLDFVSKGHQRGAVRLLAARAYALCPEILNDAREAPWSIAIRSHDGIDSVELTPKLTPDPRFCYRQDDVPAASHPPLAACLARLAGTLENAVIWDPFCGSGLELIERTRLGGVLGVYGTDRSAEAIEIAQANFAASGVPNVRSKFVCGDFRDFVRVEGLGRNSIGLIITNPPMGKRVHVGDLQRLIEDLLSVAAAVLQPGGKLVFANPVHILSQNPVLKLKWRSVVDFGGFDCRVEVYQKLLPTEQTSTPETPKEKPIHRPRNR